MKRGEPIRQVKRQGSLPVAWLIAAILTGLAIAAALAWYGP